jgi:hypothetical protein
MALSLLMLHVLVAVVLIGAVTHQVFSLWRPVPAEVHRNLWKRFRSVRSIAFTKSIAVLYVLAVIGGGIVYPFYVLDAKKPLLNMGLEPVVGVFEIKEHFAILGLGLLPAYVSYWASAENDRDLAVRRILTVILALFVWWNFWVGHVVTAIRGIF